MVNPLRRLVVNGGIPIAVGLHRLLDGHQNNVSFEPDYDVNDN